MTSYFESSSWPEDDLVVQPLDGAETLPGFAPRDDDSATAPPQEDEEPWVDLEFPGHSWKLVCGVPEEPARGEQVILRSYAAGAKKAVIDRDTDLLTPSELQSESARVKEAMHKELLTWVKYECFARHPRVTAKNIIDTRWVLKWKWVKVNGKRARGVRARLTVCGFKDAQAQDL